MTMSDAQTRAPVHLSVEGVTLLRSLLLCQLAEQADQAAECRVKVEKLTGQIDADGQLERELAESSAAHYEGVVREARHALQRMEDGTYGTCERGATPIPHERLEVIPQARLCVRCLDASPTLSA